MKYSITSTEDMGKTYQVLNVVGVTISDRTDILKCIEDLIDKGTLLIYPGKGIAGLRGTEFIKMIDGAYDEDAETTSLSITSNEGIIRYLIHLFDRRIWGFTLIENSETKESVN